MPLLPLPSPPSLYVLIETLRKLSIVSDCGGRGGDGDGEVGEYQARKVKRWKEALPL